MGYTEKKKKLHLLMKGVCVQSSIWELRLHMPQGQKAKMQNRKKYCNKFDEDFKNGLH